MKKTGLTGCEALRALADGYEVKDCCDNVIRYLGGVGFTVRGYDGVAVSLNNPPYAIVEAPGLDCKNKLDRS